jgi:GntR family transcriptional regulator/MocR family aminotransferase
MAADDPAGLVIYISTFSKLMFGGARIGYVAASKPFIEQLAAYKAMINHKTNALIQQCVANWMRSGDFESHLRRMTKLYLARRNYMVAALKTYQSEGLPLRFEVPAGGMAIWLDTGKSIVGLKEQLFSEQVYLQTEVEFDVTGYGFNGFSCNAVNQKNRGSCIVTNKNTQQPLRFIRLGFASMNETELDQGLSIVMRSLYGNEY